MWLWIPWWCRNSLRLIESNLTDWLSDHINLSNFFVRPNGEPDHAIKSGKEVGLHTQLLNRNLYSDFLFFSCSIVINIKPFKYSVWNSLKNFYPSTIDNKIRFVTKFRTESNIGETHFAFIIIISTFFFYIAKYNIDFFPYKAFYT